MRTYGSVGAPVEQFAGATRSEIPLVIVGYRGGLIQRVRGGRHIDTTIIYIGPNTETNASSLFPN